MINWVLQLNNGQSGNSFNSFLVKHHVSSFPNEPNLNPNQSVFDRSQNVFLWIKEKRPVHTRSMINVLHKEFGSSDRSGKLEKLSEDIRVRHAHDGTVEPVKSSASKNIVKEQFVSEEHRDIAPSNADNKFNLATDEENIDFNIPGVPSSTVKRSHGVNVHNLIQKIEKHPQRQALQSDLQQHRAFNLFSKESQEVIKAAGNTELCEKFDVEPKAQGKACLSYWIVYCTCGYFLRERTRYSSSSLLTFFSIPNYFIKKGRPHGHRYGKKDRDHEYFIVNSFKKKCKKKNFLGIHDRFIRDEKFRKTMIELGRTEEVCREMDKLAKEDHTHFAPAEEIRVYRDNWWIRSNFADTMFVRHRVDFKEALFFCDASRTKRIRLITQICGKALHFGGSGKIPGGIFHLSITATMNPALIDW